MADEVILNCTLNVNAVSAASEPRLIYLLIDMRAGPDAPGRQVPVNLAVVLDVSESMRLPVLSQAQFDELARLGQVDKTVSDGVPVWTFKKIPDHIRKQAPSNLEAVKSSIAQSTRYLEEHDLVSLVAFADRADLVLSAVPGSDQQRVMDAVNSLDSVSLGDETDIGAGLEAAIGELKREVRPGAVTRMLTLTDGFTRFPDKVMKLVGEARAAGIGVSTLGIGTEFNEKLLVDMADASLGNAYFARVPQEIPPAFGQELAAVMSISMRDVQIDIKLSTGVEMRRAYRVRPAISSVRDARRDGRSVIVSMGDLDPAENPALLVELIVPTQPGGTFRIAHIAVTHAGSGQAREQAAGTDVVLDYSLSGRREVLNAAVMNTVERVTAYTLQTRALDDMAAGNVAGATQKLKAAATRLLAIGETDLAQSAQAEAARLQQSGQVSPEGAKELRYATRKLTQRLE